MRPRHACLAALILLLGAAASRAGMPSPLPGPEVLQRVLRLNEPPLARLQALSFFLLVLGACALLVQLLWNYLRRDFPRMPRLSYGRALAGVVLWGLLFVSVLVMISGARELMTPGAWQKQGFTYRLTPESGGPQPDPLAQRRQHMERLRQALWHFAATHDGRFPSTGEMAEVPGDLWAVPEAGGLRYQYTPGLSVRGPVTLLAWEPELNTHSRLALRSNGDIATLSSPQIRALEQEKQPR
jgi:hypothetical protein